MKRKAVEHIRARLPERSCLRWPREWIIDSHTPLAYCIDLMIFKETTVFTRQISNLISDDAYREFQQELIFNPIAGDLIKGSGGLRKIRWRSATGGKRGGIRVIYTIGKWPTVRYFSFLPTARPKRRICLQKKSRF